MCEAMDVIVQKIENKGIRKGEASGIRKGIRQGMQQGIQQGILQGILQGKLETVLSLFRDGTINAEKAANILGITANQFLAEAGMN